jgi:hypothetical protein
MSNSNNCTIFETLTSYFLDKSISCKINYRNFLLKYKIKPEAVASSRSIIFTFLNNARPKQISCLEK